VLRYFLAHPPLILVCVAGAIRNGAGLVWAYNTNLFYSQTRNLSPQEIAKYMSWVPLVSGAVGAIVGGLLADKWKVGASKQRAQSDATIKGQVYVLVGCQLLAAPLAVGVLYASIPGSFIAQLFTNIFGECRAKMTIENVGSR
jgi:hypothetical protein